VSARLRYLLYAAFVVAGLLRFHGAGGDDLSASYIGCRLLASGGGANLYDFDPVYFQEVSTPAWKAAAEAAHFSGYLHPYVQTPLWAWSLRPLCETLDFDAFRGLFLALGLASVAALVELVARAWAPKFLAPIACAPLLVALSLTTPFSYAMELVQTHALFLTLSVGALIAADRERPVLAGASLALAAAVKITPAFLILYWLMRGQGRAALAFVAVSALLAGATVLAVGVDVVSAYVASMRRVSDVLLLAYNNQSLAAWWSYTPADAFHLTRWRALPLPAGVKIVSLLASLGACAFAGWRSRGEAAPGAAPAFALVALTLFAPIAWTHYFLALVPAAMVLAQLGGAAAWAAVAAMFVLDVPPLALDPLHPHFAPWTLARSHFYSGVLALLGLARADRRA